jgi:hypothetical protein
VHKIRTEYGTSIGFKNARPIKTPYYYLLIQLIKSQKKSGMKIDLESKGE